MSEGWGREKPEDVFGEAFFKKLQKNAAFLKKGDIQKLSVNS
ncbi:hypothetical protein [Komagataeibacter melomenusus]|nr:hypothetical protein [Komagataeibacter melomenusus]